MTLLIIFLEEKMSDSKQIIIISEINFKKEYLDVKSNVHLLPCKIIYDGEANIESYFILKISKMKNNRNG
jgi:hypothetical protein